MLDIATPGSAFDPRAGHSPWGAGPGAAVPDPYGGGMASGFDDPFGGPDAGRPSIPAFGTQPVQWTAPQQPAGSPFSATLKAVPPRSSVPSAPVPQPLPQKLWGAAPAPGTRPSAVPVKQGTPGWQIALIAVLVLGLGAAVFLVMRAR